MKKITALSIVSALMMVVGVFTFNSCSKDSTDACKNVTCVNGTLNTVGTVCSCTCSTGAFGSGCANTFNGLFLTSGASTTWKIIGETSNGTPIDFAASGDSTVTISAGSTNSTISLLNFEGLRVDSTTAAKLSYTLTLNDSLGTVITTTDTVVGYSANPAYRSDKFKIYRYSGTLNATKTVFNYTFQINVGGTVETAVGTLVKQ